MLVRGIARLFPPITLTLIVVFAIIRHRHQTSLRSWSFGNGKWVKEDVTPLQSSKEKSVSPESTQTSGQYAPGSIFDINDDPKLSRPRLQNIQDHIPGTSSIGNTHNEIFSLTTPSGGYFPILFGDHETLNPNIIPHPSSDNKWIIVAQQKAQDENLGRSTSSIQLVCDAVFRTSDIDDDNDNDNDDDRKNYDLAQPANSGSSNGNEKPLTCVTSPTALPISATDSGNRCQGPWEPLNLNVGPHDARVFYGPQIPYVIYGSNSQYTCFGQWVQDFRMLTDWDPSSDERALTTGVDSTASLFRAPTELHRPAPYGQVEKNWFIFWDTNGDSYVHYDVWPQRSFAKIERQTKHRLPGEPITEHRNVGPDLAIWSGVGDSKCMHKYMPDIQDVNNAFIHQASNSLSLTVCKRSETDCQPSDSNTFIFTIFQKKVHVETGGSSYEPYVMLFRRTGPFELHAISTKPFWIHGRKKTQPGVEAPEMMYITSMSWMDRSQKYHGFSDDTLFLAFGINDSQTAGIDIQAGDLLKDMGVCMNS